MIKNNILSIFLLFNIIIMLNGFDNEDFCTATIGLNNSSSGGYLLYSNKDEISLVIQPILNNNEKNNEKILIYNTINRSSIKRDEYGYPVATFFGKETHFLFGGNYVIFRFLDELESGMVYTPSTIQTFMRTKGYSMMGSGIEIYCSSYLNEGIKYYTSDSLNQTFLCGIIEGGQIFNTTILPWAEGEEGSGIGINFSINFLPETNIAEVFRKHGKEYIGIANSITIMNGYVDFYRPDLFLKNNRVKRVLIKSTDDEEYYEFEFELKDVPEFQTIHLPRMTNSLEMTIMDVYKGTLYDDTVITSILPLGKNFTYKLGTLDEIINKPYFVKWEPKRVGVPE